MIAAVFVAIGFLVLAHGTIVALCALGVLLATFAAVIAVHNLHRDKPAAVPTPEPPAVAPRVYGSRRPSQHRRTSFVRHVASYRKTGANR